jgi:hypothetical protein
MRQVKQRWRKRKLYKKLKHLAKRKHSEIGSKARERSGIKIIVWNKYNSYKRDDST